MTVLTNAAILLAARELTVACGGCRMRAVPVRVLGLVLRRGVTHDQITEHAVVAFTCSTPSCDQAPAPVEFTL